MRKTSFAIQRVQKPGKDQAHQTHYHDEITVSAPDERGDLEAAQSGQGSEERSRAMMIIGCDLHTRYQQVAMVDTETGELVERRLEHASGEAKSFYAALSGPVRVGIEATGHTHWFEAMLAEFGHELWMGGRLASPKSRGV